MTAAVMMLRHIGLTEKAAVLEAAVKKADDMLGARMTGLPGGAGCAEFAGIVKENI